MVLADRADLHQGLRDAPAPALDLLLRLLERVGRDELRFQQFQADVFLLHGRVPLGR
jgi:hypothetical protein